MLKTTIKMAAATASTNSDRSKIDCPGVDTGAKILVGLKAERAGSAKTVTAGPQRMTRPLSTSVIIHRSQDEWMTRATRRAIASERSAPAPIPQIARRTANPHRAELAGPIATRHFSASRRSVFTRAPALVGTSDGANTRTRRPFASAAVQDIACRGLSGPLHKNTSRSPLAPTCRSSSVRIPVGSQ